MGSGFEVLAWRLGDCVPSRLTGLMVLCDLSLNERTNIYLLEL